MDFEIEYNNCAIYDFIPGFKFRVLYDNDTQEGNYNVSVQEDTEYNIKFNGKSHFTYDNFVSFLHTTNIIDALKGYTGRGFTLTFIIFNEHILKGTNITNFKEGIFCVGVKNNYTKFDSNLRDKFCKEFNIPYAKSIYFGKKPANPEFEESLMERSRISADGKVYGLYVFDRDSESHTVYKSGVTDFVKDETMEGSRLLEEFTQQKATAQFIIDSLEKTNKTLRSNISRIYDSIIQKIEFEPEYAYYREEILNYENEAWLDKNLRPSVIRAFRPVLVQMKEGIKGYH